ncbi:hypothetical protein [Anaeromyxobacter dehalogenans]|uniref:hypothetical protein n=1 Tax=Anaeromyxobacter dehalogenans TaxID=161493 RepID=UPI00059B9F00|nr:hypothetical protein [Anaeromyxobacter dehalogenans]
MPQVDSLLRSDILASVGGFRAPASEPIWADSGEPTTGGAQLFFYVTRAKHHFASLGVFWVHALFNFLEDRLETEALVQVATRSLCHEVTPAEVVDALQSRMGRPLENTERATMLMTGGRALRVFSMLVSEVWWAGLVEAEGACVAVFLDSTSKQ